MAETFTNAQRVLTGWTSAGEKRLLLWMAHRLPARIHADHLTALAAAAMATAALAYLAVPRWPPALVIVDLCLLVNWFGDSLDGTIARVRGHERPRYGFYVDHVLDCAGIAALVAGMGASGLMSPVVALGFLAAYLLVSAEAYLATYCLGTFRLTVAGIGPTELRLLLMAGNIAALSAPVVTLASRPLRLFDIGGTVAVAGLLVVFVAAAVGNGRRLFRDEPRKTG